MKVTILNKVYPLERIPTAQDAIDEPGCDVVCNYDIESDELVNYLKIYRKSASSSIVYWKDLEDKDSKWNIVIAR